MYSPLLFFIILHGIFLVCAYNEWSSLKSNPRKTIQYEGKVNFHWVYKGVWLWAKHLVFNPVNYVMGKQIFCFKYVVFM